MVNLLNISDEVLSSRDIAQFNQDGFLHLKDVLNPSEVHDLRQAVGAQLRNKSKTTTGYDFESLAYQLWSDEDDIDSGEAMRFDLELYRHIIKQDETARPIREKSNHDLNGEGMFFYEAAGWRNHHEIRDVAFDSKLPPLCAKLLDTSYLNFWEDTTFVKGPNTPQKTTFHQDYTYFQIQGLKCCVVWIPLDKASRKTGAMQYVRGSHLWGHTFAPNVFIAQTPLLDAPDPKLPDIEANPDDYDIVTVEAEPGDVIIHHVLTIHGAKGNMSEDQIRRAISFRYCGDDIRYFDRPGAIPQPYISNPLPDGTPLYSRDYPLVWPKPAPEIKLAPLFRSDHIAI